jgi:peptidoglycan/LPS O-acetylase OafA/YrhL
MRFVAAALIVEAHSHEYFQLPQLQNFIQVTQAVSFFYVLSGFVMAYNYAGVRGRSWRSFYVARFARIWPLHIATLLIYIIISKIPSPPDGLLTRSLILASNVLLLQSWIPLKEFVFSFNAPAWSLSTEIGFYLLFPLLITLNTWPAFPRRAVFISAALAVAFVAFAAAVQIPLLGAPWRVCLIGIVLANPLARLFEFVLGIVVCNLSAKLRFTGSPWHWTLLEILVCLAALASSWACAIPRASAIPNQALQHFIIWSGSAPIFAALILIFSAERGRLSGWFGHRVFVFLGEVSFAVYLVHVPVLCALLRWPILPRQSYAGLFVYAACVLAAATGLHKLIELPARRWLVRAGTRPSPPLLA